jgi:hypothetical protein
MLTQLEKDIKESNQRTKIINNLNQRLGIDDAKKTYDMLLELKQTKEQKEKLFNALLLEEEELNKILSKKALNVGFDNGSILSLDAICSWLYEGNITFIFDLKPKTDTPISSHGFFIQWVLEEIGLN